MSTERYHAVKSGPALRRLLEDTLPCKKVARLEMFPVKKKFSLPSSKNLYLGVISAPPC